MVVQRVMDNMSVRIQNRTAGKIDGGIGKFTDQKAEYIMLRQLINLRPELKSADNVLHIFRESIQI